jgi:hypothetical protein
VSTEYHSTVIDMCGEDCAAKRMPSHEQQLTTGCVVVYYDDVYERDTG